LLLLLQLSFGMKKKKKRKEPISSSNPLTPFEFCLPHTQTHTMEMERDECVRDFVFFFYLILSLLLPFLRWQRWWRQCLFSSLLLNETLQHNAAILYDYLFNLFIPFSVFVLLFLLLLLVVVEIQNLIF
jgi:hypothetical protein